jgi:hypothetical protein
MVSDESQPTTLLKGTVDGPFRRAPNVQLHLEAMLRLDFRAREIAILQITC